MIVKTRVRYFCGLLAAVLILSLLGAVPALADYAYYYPYFANSASGEAIGLALTNVTDKAAAVTIVIKDQGGVTKKVEEWNLAARGQKAGVIGADLDLKGSFQVYSDQPLTGLCFMFTNDMTTMYDIPGTATPARQLLIPHVAQSRMWNMNIAVANPNAVSTDVSLSFRSADGVQEVVLKNFHLTPFGSTVLPLGDLLTASLENTESGSLKLVSTVSGLVAFSTYDDLKNGGSFNAGLVAVDPADQTENYTLPTRSQYAAIAAAAADYSSGAHALVGVEPPRAAQTNLLPDVSDIIMAADGPSFYRIQRYQSDSIVKFTAGDPARPVWNYSTNDPESPGSSNPHDMIFVNPGHGDSAKAYIPRFDTTKLWIVNPQAETADQFKTGEIDLSAYADADGIPEMHRGVIVNGKLFLLVNRLDRTNNWEPGQAYVVVIDIATDQEIDTHALRGVGGEATGLKGISMPVRNLWSIAYCKDTGKVYVQAVGRFPSSWSGTPAGYSGGIVTIDPESYETEVLVDDGTDEIHPYGNFSGMALVSGSRGYFISYAGYGDNAVWGFNPTTGKVDSAPIAAFPGGSGIATIAVDGHGKLWVGGSGAVTIVDPANGDAVEQVINLGLNPTTDGIAFGTYAEPAEDSEEPDAGSGGGGSGGGNAGGGAGPA